MNTITTAEGIADEISTRLAAVRVLQGAETDIGVSVYRGRSHIDEDMLPCCSIIELGDTPNHRGPTTAVESRWEFAAVVYLACDPSAPNVAAHKAIRDVKRAIFRTDGKPSRVWAGKVRGLEYLGYEMAPRSDGAAFVVAIVKFAVLTFEDVANP
jgi:hypothetical protein